MALLGCGGAPSAPAPAPTRPLSAASTGDVALRGHPAAPGRASWAPWPQALHDAQRSGAAAVPGPTSGAVRWKRRLEGDVTPGPVVGADGTVYAATNAGVLHALDPATGRDRWTVDGGGSYGLDQSTSPAVLRDGTVLWPGPGQPLLAVSPAGAVRWRLVLGAQVTSPAVLPDGRVVVGDAGGLLVALSPDARGPHEQWRLDLAESTYGSPAISPDGATVYQSVLSGVVAVRDGRLVWRWRVPSQIVEVSPAVGPDGTVVIGTNDPYEYGLDPRDGSVRWRFSRGRWWTYSSPGVTADGIAYFGDHADRVTGLDVRTGALLYRHLGPTARRQHRTIGIWTAVLVDSEHRVYAGTRQGLIYGADADGHRLWVIDTGATVDSYPALTADGALIVGTTDGDLLAIADR